MYDTIILLLFHHSQLNLRPLHISRGVGKGGAGGAAAPHFLASEDNFLSSAMPLHTSVYRTNGNI